MGYCSQAVYNVKSKHTGSWAVPVGGDCCHGSSLRRRGRRRDNVDSIARLKELDQGVGEEWDLLFATFTPLTQSMKMKRELIGEEKNNKDHYILFSKREF